MNGRSVSWPSPNRPFKACSAGLTVAYSNLYVFFMFLVGSCAQGDAAPKVVDMHGIRVVYMYKEGDDNSVSWPSPTDSE